MTAKEKKNKNSRLPENWSTKTQAVQPKNEQDSKGIFQRLSNLPLIHRFILLMLVVVVIAIVVFPAKKDTNDAELNSAEAANEQPIPDYAQAPKNVLVEHSHHENETTNQAEAEISYLNDAEKDAENKDATDSSGNSQDIWFSYVVESGDTAANIFRDQDLSLLDLYALVAIEGSDKPLSKIKPKQELKFKLDVAGELTRLEINSRNKKVAFVRNAKGKFARE